MHTYVRAVRPRTGWLIAGAIVALAVLPFVRQALSPNGTALDARVYRDAARAFLGLGDIYAQRFDGLPFTYPPFAVLPFTLLAVLPAAVALVLMFALSSGSLVAIVRWCQQYVTGGDAGPWWATVALAGAAALVLEPVTMTLGFGQVNLILLALVLGVDARATRWAGVGAGIAAAVKVTPGLLVVAQLVRGDLRAFRRGALAFLAATAVAALVAPSATFTYFGHLLWDSNRPGNLAYLQNQSLRAVVERHAPGHQSLWLLLALVALVLGAVAVRVHRHDAFAALTAAGITALLISPVSWSHHWVWVLPVTAVGLRAARRTPLRWASLALLAVCASTTWLWRDVPALPGEDMYVAAGLVWLVAALATRPGAAPLPARSSGYVVVDRDLADPDALPTR